MIKKREDTILKCWSKAEWSVRLSQIEGVPPFFVNYHITNAQQPVEGFKRSKDNCGLLPKSAPNIHMELLPPNPTIQLDKGKRPDFYGMLSNHHNICWLLFNEDSKRYFLYMRFSETVAVFGFEKAGLRTIRT